MEQDLVFVGLCWRRDMKSLGGRSGILILLSEKRLWGDGAGNKFCRMFLCGGGILVCCYQAMCVDGVVF